MPLFKFKCWSTAIASHHAISCNMPIGSSNVPVIMILLFRPGGIGRMCATPSQKDALTMLL